ncbi:DUF3500 domain-containing protein [Microbacterium sp. HMH0099]|uniref:DUF3500 domain-containing protein n=1 Tax=Microbacterium sp. HMH0099 TaxID=3414026 RepID=UPI003BF658B9
MHLLNPLYLFRRNTDSAAGRKRANPVVALGAGIAVMSMALAGCATTVDATSTATPTTSVSSSASATSTTNTTTDSDGASATTTAETISDTAAAAEAFLATLSAEQRDAILYAYDDETKTTSWSNFPITFVQRAGLNLADLTDEQKTAALKVLESLLSDEAYETDSNIASDVASAALELPRADSLLTVTPPPARLRVHSGVLMSRNCCVTYRPQVRWLRVAPTPHIRSYACAATHT